MKKRDVEEKPWPEVAAVKHLGGTVLHVTFDDGAEGDIDVAKRLRLRGVFARMKDPAFVAKVRVDADSGTIEWPNGANIDPVVLYHYVTGKPMPDWAGPIGGS